METKKVDLEVIIEKINLLYGYGLQHSVPLFLTTIQKELGKGRAPDVAIHNAMFFVIEVN